MARGGDTPAAEPLSSTIAISQQVQEYSLMFGFRMCVKSVSLLSLAAVMAVGATSLDAQQTPKRRGHETNANRKARIERTIQDTYSHKYEVAGGGGYLRFRSGESLQRNNEVTFFLSGTQYLASHPRIGIVADIRGAYGNAKVGNTEFNIANPQISEYTFLGGVNYRVYAREKYAVSVFGVGGAAAGKFDSGSKGIPSAYLGLWESGFKPAFSIGANLDYNFYPNLALRIQPTYVPTFFRLASSNPLTGQPYTNTGSIQNNVGVNIGLVYRFGRMH